MLLSGQRGLQLVGTPSSIVPRNLQATNGLPLALHIRNGGHTHMLSDK